MTTPESAASSLVQCESVRREYGGPGSRLSRGDGRHVRALDDVSLTIESDEVVGISGASGSGKSTLLHLLAALDTPTSGRVRIDGVDVSDLGASAQTRFRLDHIGVVFQRFHLLPSLSARGNVALPLVELGVSRAERRRRAEAYLDRVGLGDRLTHRPAALSGGEQQRVAIARALVTDPDLVVADEPTGELDSATGAEVLDLLAEVAMGDSDRAVVLASHDQDALERADRVIELLDGQRVDQ